MRVMKMKHMEKTTGKPTPIPVHVSVATHAAVKRLSGVSGVKIKVLADEALAVGLPAVAARRGVEGFAV